MSILIYVFVPVLTTGFFFRELNVAVPNPPSTFAHRIELPLKFKGIRLRYFLNKLSVFLQPTQKLSLFISV